MNLLTADCAKKGKLLHPADCTQICLLTRRRSSNNSNRMNVNVISVTPSVVICTGWSAYGISAHNLELMASERGINLDLIVDDSCFFT